MIMKKVKSFNFSIGIIDFVCEIWTLHRFLEEQLEE